MEKLKTVFDNIKDRFSNPLVFSFVCSWLIINWQITVGLIWYDTRQIEKTGCTSVFEFISDKLTTNNTVLFPFLFALVYTLVMPIIKNIIRAFYSWAAKWGDNWNLKITMGVKIPFEKYLKFREDYEKRTKILEEVIVKESEYANNYNSLNTELLQAKTTINDLIQKQTDNNNFEQQLTDNKILNGYWTNKYSDTINKTLSGTEDVQIVDGKYYVIEKFGERKHVFNITDFYYNNRSKKMFFIKENINQNSPVKILGNTTILKFNVNVLKMERGDLLAGIENQTTQIQYLRKSIES